MADLTEEEILARIALLEGMRDSGVLITRHGDTSVQFRSLDDLLRALRILRKQLASAMGLNKSRVSYIRQKSRGYGPGEC
jgi:hypothetical protein